MLIFGMKQLWGDPDLVREDGAFGQGRFESEEGRLDLVGIQIDLRVEESAS
jgi:hypothetical protein